MKAKPGDLMMFTYWGKVNRVSGSSLSFNELDHGIGEINVHGSTLIAESHSADAFKEEKKVTMTQAAEFLVGAKNRPFTVCFEKKDGEERVLRGRLVKPEPLLGRSMVEDLDNPKNDRQRLVDHRTIKWLILEGMKYVVK